MNDKITITIKNKYKEMTLVMPVDSDIAEWVTAIRTIMTHSSWHPDIVESMFNKETLEDYGA